MMHKYKFLDLSIVILTISTLNNNSKFVTFITCLSFKMFGTLQKYFAICYSGLMLKYRH